MDMEERAEQNRAFCSRPELVELFPWYISGNVKPDERDQIEEHVDQCSRCREDLKFFLDLRRVERSLFGNE